MPRLFRILFSSILILTAASPLSGSEPSATAAADRSNTPQTQPESSPQALPPAQVPAPASAENQQPESPATPQPQPQASVADPEPPVSPDDVYIEGRLKPLPAASNAPAGVVLVASALDERDNEIRVPYRVVADAIGQRLAAQMLHNTVEVRCTLENRGSEEKPDLWITVKSFVLVPETGH